MTLIFSSLNCQNLLLSTLYCLVEPGQSSICIPHKLESVLQSIEMWWSLWEKAVCGVGIPINPFNIESERVQTSTHRPVSYTHLTPADEHRDV